MISYTGLPNSAYFAFHSLSVSFPTVLPLVERTVEEPSETSPSSQEAFPADRRNLLRVDESSVAQALQYSASSFPVALRPRR